MNIDEMKDRIARAEEIQRYTENRCEVLEKENAELKSEKGCETCTKFDEVQLTKAKDIIKSFLSSHTDDLIVEAEQFLKENE